MTMTEEEIQGVSHSNLDQENPEIVTVDKSMKNLSLDGKAGEDDHNGHDDEGSVKTESEQTASEKDVVDEGKESPEQEELVNGKSSSKKDQHQTRAERLEKQIELDSRSIFVGNITTEATAESLEEHFKDCGEIVRVTILYNKLTGAPKGYAYIEFENVDSVAKALEKKDSQLHGETINVAKKRTNVPGYNNKNNYPRKEWIYPSWQGNVVRQWYYPYSAPAYQNYKPNGMPMPPPPPRNAFYSQYPYVSRPAHNGGQKMPGYSRGYYRGNYRGNYNGRRGNSNYRGPRNQNNGHYSRPDSHRNENGDATPATATATAPSPSTTSPVSETSEGNTQVETVETTSDVPASKVEE